MSSTLRNFSEREFYLTEFRGRTIGIAWPASEALAAPPLAGVMDVLVENGSRVVLMSSLGPVFAAGRVEVPVDASHARFAPSLWRALRDSGRAGLRVAESRFAEDCRDVALALRLAKLVWIQSEPPVEIVDSSRRVSVVDLPHLEPLLAPGRAAEDAEAAYRVRPGREEMLTSIRQMIEGGIPAVNVCAPKDLERELFTYAGAGTFFTRDRYAEVRPLGLDDYDLASDLIQRGEADGYLAPRDPAQRDAVLAHAVGVFIEGRYLAGIGAILPYPGARAAELAAIFALTRYVGEGAGGQIMGYAIERARSERLAYLFGCTTSDRVEGFFARHGFRRVGSDEVPAEKWSDYDLERRNRIRCMRLDL